MSANNRIVSIVDDELDITDLFHDAFCKINRISVFTFNDPIKALKHFTSNKQEYVLVLSDYRMPGLNGLDLLRKVKTLNRYVRTILMSAYDVGSDDLLRKYLLDEIINKFIPKPITILRLSNEVNNQVHAYELNFK